ncbi:NAD(P)-binding protein [Hypoxylon sp. FL1150]|nr:NAD(P)-binding protein [Hypoxylon sp. FL1150]
MASAPKVALITGGAAGIGYAVARMLATKGWLVSIVDTNQERGPVVAMSIGATYYKADVRDYDSLRNAFDDTVKRHSRLDFVFANAGITDPRNFYQVQTSTLPPAPSLDVFDINLKGAVSCAYLAQHYIRLCGRNGELADLDPSIVFMSSIAGLEVYSPIPLYTAAKHGLMAFACAIATPFKESGGIRVSCICPGPVSTEKRKPSDADRPDMVPVERVCEAVDELIGPDGGFGRCLRIISTGVSDV